MPHQCTACGRTFDDGSKEMLSGCPDCGGNKFQFKPKGSADEGPPGGSDRDQSARKPSANERPGPGSEPAGGGTQSDSAPSERSGTPPTGTTSASADGPDASSAADAATPGETAGSTTDPSTPSTTDPSTPSTTDPSTPSTTDPSTPSTTDPSSADVGSERFDDRDDEDTAQASARSDVVSPDELDRASQEVPAQGDAEGVDGEHRPDIDDLRQELNDQFESIRIVSPGKYELNLMELYDRQEYIISLQEDGRYVIEMPDAWGATDE